MNLRALLAQNQILVAPGVFDAWSALLEMGKRRAD